MNDDAYDRTRELMDEIAKFLASLRVQVIDDDPELRAQLRDAKKDHPPCR